MALSPREHDNFLCLVRKICEAGVPAEAIEAVLNKAEVHGSTEILGYFQEYCCEPPWAECTKCGVKPYPDGATPVRPKQDSSIPDTCPTCTTGGGGVPTVPAIPGITVPSGPDKKTTDSADVSKFRELACSPVGKMVINNMPMMTSNAAAKAAFAKWCEKGEGWETVKAYFCAMPGSMGGTIAEAVSPTALLILAAIKAMCPPGSTSSPLPSLPSIPGVPALPGIGGTGDGKKSEFVDNSTVFADMFKKLDWGTVLPELVKIPGVPTFLGQLLPPLTSNPTNNFLAWTIPQMLTMPGYGAQILRSIGFGDKADEVWKQVMSEGPFGPMSLAHDAAKALVGYGG